jgi:hypothetical protein
VLKTLLFQGGSNGADFSLRIDGGGVGAGFTCRVVGGEYQVLAVFMGEPPTLGGPATVYVYQANGDIMNFVSEQNVNYTPVQAEAAVGAHCSGLTVN